MRDNRIAFLTACCLSAGAFIFHLLFLILHFTSGIGLIGKKDAFNRELFDMHFMAYWPGILLVLVAIASYFIFSGIVYYFFLFIRQLGEKKISTISLMLRCWLVAYFSVIVINCNLFPNSFFSTPVFISPPSPWYSINIFHATIIISCAVVLCACVIAIQKLIRHKILFSTLLLLLFGLMGHSLYASYKKPNSESVRMGYENKKPNVIVIYYCSFVAHYLQDYPNFKLFADHSVWFQNVLSPTARSAPGTFEFLSGLYPINSHFFENLNWRDSRIPYKASLPYLFQKAGYQTVFITNINAFRRLDSKLRWGFQSIFSPPTNVIGVLLAKMNDLPLTNLLFYLPFNKNLFSLNYNNADDSVHYTLSGYLAEVKNVLSHHLTRKPLFLVLNDESLHYPYAIEAMSNLSELDRYKILMERVDQQFSQYIIALKKQHLLDNAILILTADHGESPGPDAQSNLMAEAVDNSSDEDHDLLLKKLGSSVVYGHGGDVMMREQYRVPLVFHFYGNHQTIKMPQKNDALNSTLDIMPTLFQLLNMPALQRDGQSLLPEIKGQKETLHVLYANSGINVALPENSDKMKALARKIKSAYRVAPDGAFGLNLAFLAKLKRNMSLAIYWKNVCLVYFPENITQDKKISIPALFAIINEKKFALSLLTRPELNQFLAHPDAAKLKALDINTNEVRHLLSLVTNYHKKVLLSANGNPAVRMIK